MITASQCRAARGLLNWSQQELADAAHLGVATVRVFEGGGGPARRSTLALLQQAFEAAGVEFTNGDYPGARLVGAAIGAAGARPKKQASTTKKGPHKRS